MKSASNPYHAEDCGCARCPNRPIRQGQRQHRLLIALTLWLVGVAIGTLAILNATSAQ